ncbi:MAG: hypothetical protein EPO62_06355 [Candidatus Nitrosotenuis sp.]|nr:MAG: hypothetical protein EPO62_06355 [Candidatus Nitrosotenuis sp.]
MMRLAALVVIATLLSMAVISAIDAKHSAEAMKATSKTKNLRHKTAHYMGNSVCGDELCPGHSYFKWNMKYRTFTSPYNTYEHQALMKVKSAQ